MSEEEKINQTTDDSQPTMESISVNELTELSSIINEPSKIMEVHKPIQ